MIEQYDGFESWERSFSGVDDKAVDINQLCQYLVQRILNYNINFLSSIIPGLPNFSLQSLVPLPDPVKTMIVSQLTNELTGKINSALDLQKGANTNTIAYTLSSAVISQLSSWMQGSYSEEASRIANGTIFDYGGDLFSNPKLLLAYLISQNGLGWSLLIGSSPSSPGYFTKLISNAMEDFCVDILGVPLTTVPATNDAFGTGTGTGVTWGGLKPSVQSQEQFGPSGLTVGTQQGNQTKQSWTLAPTGTGSKLPIVPIAIGIAAIILLKKKG